MVAVQLLFSKLEKYVHNYSYFLGFTSNERLHFCFYITCNYIEEAFAMPGLNPDVI